MAQRKDLGKRNWSGLIRTFVNGPKYSKSRELWKKEGGIAAKTHSGVHKDKKPPP